MNGNNKLRIENMYLPDHHHLTQLSGKAARGSKTHPLVPVHITEASILFAFNEQLNILDEAIAETNRFMMRARCFENK